MATLPYVTAPGNIEKALNGIKSAATPERVSQDFVKTVLGVKGGSGHQMTSFLKKIGFTNSDGTPSELYKRFRSSDKTVSGRAVADAIKFGFRPLYVRNEYAHQLNEDQLKGLILEETGASADSAAVTLAVSAIKSLKKFANFSAEKSETDAAESVASGALQPVLDPNPQFETNSGVGLNLSYTINLNLPATSDISVFNAIFKSLKENLLKND
jgi:hypothetical protein